MWLDLERDLRQLNAKIEFDPDNSSLREQQTRLTKTVDWIREDRRKRNLRDAASKLMAGKQDHSVEHFRR